MEVPRKRFLLIFFLLFIFSVLKGQDFAPLNAKWHYQEYCSQPSNYPDCGYLQVKVVKDTIIEEANSTIIKAFDRETEIPGSKIVLKSNQDQVFFFEDNAFHLLFDFSLNEGDTLFYKLPSNAEHYYLDCAIKPEGNSARAKVDSVTFRNIDGVQLKRLYLTDIGDLSNGYVHNNLVFITEKIGSAAGFFGNPVAVCLGGFPGHFRCYSDYEINFQKSDEPCDQITAIAKEKSINSISLHPNPVSGTIKVQGLLQEQIHYKILASIGSVVQEDILNFDKEISVIGFDEGFYTICFYKDGSFIGSESFVKK